MDLIITIALIYFAYRGYQWYSRLQEQVKAGPPPDPPVGDGRTTPIDITPPGDDDYIDYEEIK